jgi:cell division initiation protein
MITAQDIREKTFEKATFGGYAMNEVDDFLDELAGDIAATQKEAAVLRGKMKVLVDKIEEYRSSEDEMNRALVSAQKLARSIEEESRQKADAIIAEAQEKADAILAEAQEKADAVTGNLTQLRQAEELRYQKAQSSAAECIQVTSKKLAETLAFLQSLQDSDLIGAIVTPVPDERKAIPAPAEEPVEEAPAEEEPAPVEEAPAEEAPAPAEEAPDYFQQFEKAVYQAEQTVEDAIPEAEDGDEAPMFRF